MGLWSRASGEVTASQSSGRGTNLAWGNPPPSTAGRPQSCWDKTRWHEIPGSQAAGPGHSTPQRQAEPGPAEEPHQPEVPRLQAKDEHGTGLCGH